jgi:hypothetical protein
MTVGGASGAPGLVTPCQGAKLNTLHPGGNFEPNVKCLYTEIPGKGHLLCVRPENCSKAAGARPPCVCLSVLRRSPRLFFDHGDECICLSVPARAGEGNVNGFGLEFYIETPADEIAETIHDVKKSWQFQLLYTVSQLAAGTRPPHLLHPFYCLMTLLWRRDRRGSRQERIQLSFQASARVLSPVFCVCLSMYPYLTSCVCLSMHLSCLETHSGIMHDTALLLVCTSV